MRLVPGENACTSDAFPVVDSKCNHPFDIHSEGSNYLMMNVYGFPYYVPYDANNDPTPTLKCVDIIDRWSIIMRKKGPIASQPNCKLGNM
jgi:hypothetical protein